MLLVILENLIAALLWFTLSVWLTWQQTLFVLVIWGIHCWLLIHNHANIEVKRILNVRFNALKKLAEKRENDAYTAHVENEYKEWEEYKE